MLAMDLGLGPAADRPLNGWQESFLPSELARQLRTVRTGDGRGGSEPLVQTERLVSPNRLDPPPRTPPDLRLPLLGAGLAFAAVIVVARQWRTAYRSPAASLPDRRGIRRPRAARAVDADPAPRGLGKCQLAVVQPTGVRSAAGRPRREPGPRTLTPAQGLVAVQLGALVIAVLMHLLPGTVQQNQPWLLLSVPAWGALAWSLGTAKQRA